MTMTQPALNPKPERRLLSWGVFYAGEPTPAQRTVVISVWVPAELVRWESEHDYDSGTCRLTRLADYLREHLGFTTCVTAGWGFTYSRWASDPAELIAVNVTVRPRAVRAALAATISP